RQLRQEDRGSAALVDARALASEAGKLPPVLPAPGDPHEPEELFRCERRDRRPTRPPVTDRADTVVEDAGRFPLGKRLSVAAQDDQRGPELLRRHAGHVRSVLHFSTLLSTSEETWLLGLGVFCNHVPRGFASFGRPHAGTDVSTATMSLAEDDPSGPV